VDDFIRYQKALGQSPKAEERQEMGDLPQGYADMFGWEEMVAKIAAVYDTLTPEEKRHCVLFARNYGEAAAIDFFGPPLGLPRATCPHNSYWYWSRPDPEATVAIVIGQSLSLEENLADLRRPDRFDEATLVATTDSPHAMPYENHRMIFLCRGPRFSLGAIWPQMKVFI